MKNINFPKNISRYSLSFALTISFACGFYQNIYSQANNNSSEVTGKEALEKNKSKQIQVKADNNTVSTSKDKKERVIVQTQVEVVENENCECAFVAVTTTGFSPYGLFALGGIGFVPLALNSFDDPPSVPPTVVSQSTP